MKKLKKIITSIISHLIGSEKYSKYCKRKTAENLLKQGPKALNIAVDVAGRHNTKIGLAFGTLLGAYRDHGIIPFDYDIDVTVNFDDINQQFINDLITNGFCYKAGFYSSDSKGCHIAFTYNNAKFDIYSYTTDTDDDRVTLYAPQPVNDDWEHSEKIQKALINRYVFPYKGFVDYKFLDNDVVIFKNTGTILKMLYGENFMKPDRNYRVEKLNFDFKKIDPIEKCHFDILSKKEFLERLDSRIE